MTKDQQQTLLTARFSDLPKLFPDYPMDELRKRRKRMQSAISQRGYRKRHERRDSAVDITDDRAWREMCAEASRKYTEALARLA